MAFESGVVPEDWRSPVIVLLYKGKGERNECKNYRGISLNGENGDYLASCMQMTWFCAENWGEPEGDSGTVC